MTGRRVPDFAVVLAAGKGSRMKSSVCPKVCFPVNGVPAINRALKIYSACGIKNLVAVVGSLADKVMDVVSTAFPGVTYAYQAEQNGTAGAVSSAMSAMERVSDDADLLIVAGDRIIDENVLKKLFRLYYSEKAALAFLALSCGAASSQGRVVTDGKGFASAVIETADIRQKKVFEIIRELLKNGGIPSRDDLKKVIKDVFFKGGEIKDDKAEKAFGNLWKLASCTERKITLQALKKCVPSDTKFRFGKKSYSPDEALNIPLGNTSVYLIRKSVLKEALSRLSNDNAQKEIYLSDIVSQVRAIDGKNKVCVLAVDDRTKILGFNDPSELLEVENVLRKKASNGRKTEPLDKTVFHTLAGWKKFFSSRSKSLDALLNGLYGDDGDVWKRQTSSILELVSAAEKKYGPSKKMMLVRSPGRLNVMGRHVDHQGGNCNLMTISFETLFLVAPRKDDEVVLHNADEKSFPSRRFSIGEFVASLPWDDWNTVVTSQKLKDMISTYGVDWSNYVQAAVLRLQKQVTDKPLAGMDVMIGGNIPMAAGLSSSSSLVVGTAEAIRVINSLDIRPASFVTMCGECEWFVGTRGGSADHAAVKLGKRGTVVKVKFFDFGIEDEVECPAGYSMIVCDSGIKARKSSSAKNQFNHRIACFRIGLELLKKSYPQYAHNMKHLRDVTTANLSVPLSEIYRMLLSLPERTTRQEIRRLLPDVNLDEIFSTHDEPEDKNYPVRGVVLYGLAEMQRSAAYADVLKKGDVKYVGELMNISHNGDRVVSYDENFNETPYKFVCDDAYIADRLADLESGDVERVVRSQLIRQAGSYACSIPATDKLVDVARMTKGVLGAQLAGAGLGGCMMIFAKNEAVKRLEKRLVEHYYKPANIKPVILVCRPIAGTGTVKF